MGITGLLPLLERSSRQVSIGDFKGCTAAIDAYSWLHKGVYCCAEELARGEDSDKFVFYCMNYVHMLLANGVKPILVFDGQYLPAKAEIEEKRRNLREQNRKKAAELLRLGKDREASSLLKRSVNVTHKMALKLIKKCRSINVDCIVAPYEADSQLAFLNLSGIAHIVIAEDSDLLVFGCKMVLFKLDKFGVGTLIEQEKIHLSMNMSPEQFTLDKFRYMCILSGCDYLPSIPGVGLKKAREFIFRSSDPDIYRALSRVGSFVGCKVSTKYRDQFMDAYHMFLYQPVYDPLSRQIVTLNEVPDPNLSVLISELTNSQAYQLALGNIDPISLEVMDDWSPEVQQMTLDKNQKHKVISLSHKSIWSKDYSLYDNKTPKTILTQNVISNSPHSTQTKKINPVSSKIRPKSKIEQPIIKKCLPMTENDILNTLEEIDSMPEKKVDFENKHQKLSKKYCEIDEKMIITSDIDNILVESDESTVFKQLAKRKYTDKDKQNSCRSVGKPNFYTVMNPNKLIVSGYFSTQESKCTEEDNKEHINPFKCRKIVNPKNENTDDGLNSSLNWSNSINNDNSQVLENEDLTETDTLHTKSSKFKEDKEECINPFKCRKKDISLNENTHDDLNSSIHLSSSVEKKNSHFLVNDSFTEIKTLRTDTSTIARNLKTYSNKSTITYNTLFDDLKEQEIDSPDSQNNCVLIDDTKKADNENDIDEGFCSQNAKELIDTPKPQKSSCPRTGLSKNVGKKSQSLLSKFGFKQVGQLRR